MGHGALSIAKFCSYASVGRTTAFSEIRVGRLIAHTRGRSTIIFVEDADAWLEALPRVQPFAPDAVIAELLSPFEPNSRATRKSSGQLADTSRRAPQTSFPRGPPRKTGDAETRTISALSNSLSITSLLIEHEANPASRPPTNLRACAPPRRSLMPPVMLKESPVPDMTARAKSLMKLGLKLLPLEPTKRGVERSGKKPTTVHGVHDAPKDIATFKRLVGSAVDFNIGVATGSASDILIIDIDPRNGGDSTFSHLKERLGQLPRTMTCVTGGGGMHLYFRPPPGVQMRKKILGPGVELLADGCYAVAPPSLHSADSDLGGQNNGAPRIRRSRPCPMRGRGTPPPSIRRVVNRLRLKAMRFPKVRGTPS